MRIFKNILCFFLLVFVFSCSIKQEASIKKVQMAFLADVHFQDIYANFHDANYEGIENPVTGEFHNVRTMGSQLHSTRIFNENYFAFLAALEDITKRGIKHVILPGDFSDDGQPVHIKGLTKILNKYADKHGISFFAITGNHDPVRPFAIASGKSDFLGEGGKEQAIVSAKENLKEIKEYELAPVITSAIKKWGYKEILNEMSGFGFFPKREYLYWETPFSNYKYKGYNFETASEQAALEKRTYIIEDDFEFPDASYLVEPIEDVWLLAIDANVYIPKVKLSGARKTKREVSGAGIGYNNVLLYKTHLINWVKKVASKAKEQNKVLIAFSHYPMVDFNDDATEEIKTLFGDKKMQIHRVPNEEVAQTFADAGIQIHFGGHMHINDTGVRVTKSGSTLFNIQTPSLAAYIPAYKILTIQSNSKFEVETVVVDSVPNFKSLFPLYELEHAHLKDIGAVSIWDKEILSSETYKDLMQWHLKELVRLRFLPDSWSNDFGVSFVDTTGEKLLLKGSLNDSINSKLLAKKMTLDEFRSWDGFDMVIDFYRLRSADELAIPEIGLKRMEQYALVCEQLGKVDDKAFVLWSEIFQKVANGKPSNHFRIDLKANSIQRMNP